MAEIPSHTFSGITLTTRSVEARELRSEIERIHTGLERLSKRGQLKSAIGVLRATEFTITPGGQVHPHVHLLAFAPEAITDIASEWQQSARLDYWPNVDVFTATSVKDAVLWGRYLCEPPAKLDEDVLRQPGLVNVLLHQMAGLRLFGASKIFKSKALRPPATVYEMPTHQRLPIYRWSGNAFRC